MAKSSAIEFLVDGLQEITRKERRNLLLASTIGIAVKVMDLVPQRFSAFGLDLTLEHQAHFKALMGGVILYFVVAFAIYGLADWAVWYDRWWQAKRQLILDEDARLEERRYQSELAQRDNMLRYDDEETEDERESRIVREIGRGTPDELAWAVATVKMVFDIALPLLLGLGIGAILLVTGIYEV